MAEERNAVLAALAPSDYALLRSHLRDVGLAVAQSLQQLGDPAAQVVFPTSGLVAAMPPSNDNGGGALLIGHDGFIGGFEAAAATPAMCDAKVCVAGRALCMPAETLRDATDQNPRIRLLVARHNAALMMQAQRAALCNASHSVGARAARLLLEINDRIGDPHIRIKQYELAQMLGVQRTTINGALHGLEKAGAIDCSRGWIQICDPKQLERHACECYRDLKRCRSRLLSLPAAALSAAESAALEPKLG